MAVLVAGCMLLSGGTALALTQQNAGSRRAGVVMAECGGVLVLLAAVGFVLYLATIMRG